MAAVGNRTDLEVAPRQTARRLNQRKEAARIQKRFFARQYQGL